jgi:TolA-binding protein
LLESQGLDEQARWYYQKTITECERILNQLPETHYITAEACYFLGVCYERLGQLEEAIEFYQKVVDKWPDFKYAWNALFLVGLNYEKLKNLGLIPEAKADAKTKVAYERLLKDYPTCTAANIARQWLSRQAENK